MSACRAIEAACGVDVDGVLRDLRRLLYCGEWIESHALHVYMLHAPDFLGYESAIHMAKDHADAVQRGLELKKVGNDLVTLLGGREIHPINVRVGGFYRVPGRAELQGMVERLSRAREASLQTVRWAAGFPFPDLEQGYEFVALRHPEEYPLCEGRIVSSQGLDIDVSEYEEHFIEDHVPHSNALHSIHKGRGGYHVGPLARYALNLDRLHPVAQEAAREAGLGPVCRNPFKSILVRGVELVQACEEALRIIARYEPPGAPAVPVSPASRHGCSEPPGDSCTTATRWMRRRDPRREDRASHLAEPEDHRVGPLEVRGAEHRHGRRQAHLAVRAGRAELRSLHLLRHALPEAHRGAPVKGAVVIGVGNPDRGDDAVGLEVARRLRALPPAGVNASRGTQSRRASSRLRTAPARYQDAPRRRSRGRVCLGGAPPPARLGAARPPTLRPGGGRLACPGSRRR
jgi:hypothetical protein